MLTIQIDTKIYKNTDSPILQNLTLDIAKPGIYGVIGKNGVGKTTLFKCILNQTDYNGSILFQNQSIVLDSVLWCPAEPFLYNELTGKEFISFYSKLTRNEQQDISEYLFEIPTDELIANYSAGMRKKTYLNALFCKSYLIYVLDEPFNGLDIEANLVLIEKLKTIAKHSIVLLSSHILEMLYVHCNSIFVLQDKAVKEFSKERYTEIEACFK